jgi:hypothetical protein
MVDSERALLLLWAWCLGIMGVLMSSTGRLFTRRDLACIPAYLPTLWLSMDFERGDYKALSH